MPHGTPDWGLVGPKTGTYGLDDLGEHAVRVGSPHLWDRRGDTLLMTHFAEGLGPLETAHIGLGSSVGLWTGYARQGAYSVALTPGSDLDSYALVRGRLPLLGNTLYGLEFSFSVHADTRYWDAQIAWYVPATQWWGHLRYDHTTGNLRVWDVLLGWHTIATPGPLEVRLRIAHTIKLVVNSFDHTYVRGILDDVTYDLSPYGMVAVAPGGPDHTVFQAAHYNVTGKNPVGHVDSFIVTRNEPQKG